jgi:hypothetical protein
VQGFICAAIKVPLATIHAYILVANLQALYHIQVITIWLSVTLFAFIRHFIWVKLELTASAKMDSSAMSMFDPHSQPEDCVLEKYSHLTDQSCKVRY